MTADVSLGADARDLADKDVSRADGTATLRHIKLAVGGMTCGNCVRHVEGALRGVPGVAVATVDLGAATADVDYDMTSVDLSTLKSAVTTVGYSLNEVPAEGGSLQAELPTGRAIPWRPLIAGALAASLLTGFYLAIVGVAQGLDHAVELLVGDWYLVIPIVFGFGVQVGLFVYVRARLRLRGGTGSTKALAGAGTGTSTVSMVACCAHHLTDVLPVVGLSGAALFVNEYRTPLMLLGITGNAIGIALMLRLIRRSSRPGCSLATDRNAR